MHPETICAPLPSLCTRARYFTRTNTIYGPQQQIPALLQDKLERPDLLRSEESCQKADSPSLRYIFAYSEGCVDESTLSTRCRMLWMRHKNQERFHRAKTHPVVPLLVSVPGSRFPVSGPQQLSDVFQTKILVLEDPSGMLSRTWVVLTWPGSPC
jgi:hypothetical protein